MPDDPQPVGRVLGTEDSTPLEFWVGLDEDGYLQLDDVVLVETEVPGRATCASAASSTWSARATRAAASTATSSSPRGSAAGRDRARGACRRDALRARALRPAPAGRHGRSRRRRRARRGPLLRHDGAAAGRRARARRAADLPRPGVPRRAARRAREHLGRLRRRDEDDLRELPALRALPLRRPRRRSGQHQGADLQRQGRGPALPRQAERSADRRAARPTTSALGLPAGPFDSVGFWAPVQRDRGRRDARHRQPPAGRDGLLLDGQGRRPRPPPALPVRRGRRRAQPDRRPRRPRRGRPRPRGRGRSRSAGDGAHYRRATASRA